MLSDIEIYLPKYLSPSDQSQLFEELKQFPENIHNRLYSSQRDGDEVIFQGDGVASLPVIELPSTEVLVAKVMIVSNTCDILQDNKRVIPPSVVYCPLIRLNAYREQLLQALPKEQDRIKNHIDSVKRQECSSMFYLPAGLRLEEEWIALFDKVVNHNASALDFNELLKNRLFTLSDYGFYLFLFKLSIHFTRLREGVARGYTD